MPKTDATYNLDSLTLIQKKRLARRIFQEQRCLVNESDLKPCCKESTLRLINTVERECFHKIVFLLNGIMTLEEIVDLYGFFFRWKVTLNRTL